MRRGSLPAIVPRMSDLSLPHRHLFGSGALALLLMAMLLAVGCTRSGGASSEPEPQSHPAMSVEMPASEQVSQPFLVSGWAIDRAALEGTGVSVVQIMDEGCEGTVIGIAEYGIERTDVAANHGQQFLYSGWQFEVERLRPGEHTLAVRAKSTVAGDYNQCQAIQITVE